MKLPIEGGCACRKIRYSCSVEPLLMINCNCRDCQYSSGTGHSTVFAMQRSAVTITGEAKYYEVKSDQGNLVHRGFCEDCGSPLFAGNDKFKDFIAIKAGSLDDSSWFKPSVDIWTCSAQPWDMLSPDTQKFEKELLM